MKTIDSEIRYYSHRKENTNTVAVSSRFHGHEAACVTYILLAMLPRSGPIVTNWRLQNIYYSYIGLSVRLLQLMLMVMLLIKYCAILFGLQWILLSWEVYGKFKICSSQNLDFHKNNGSTIDHLNFKWSICRSIFNSLPWYWMKNVYCLLNHALYCYLKCIISNKRIIFWLWLCFFFLIWLGVFACFIIELFTVLVKWCKKKRRQ